MNFNFYGGRRWITTLLVIFISSGLLITGLIPSTVWQEVILWALGIYTGANVTQLGVEATKEIKSILPIDR